MSRGISRNMALDGALLDKINAFNGPGGRYYVDPASFEAIPLAAGGGDLNGSAAPVFFGQAGTDASQLGSPRLVGGTTHLFAGTPDAGAPPTITNAPLAYQEGAAVKSTDGNWSGAQNAPVWKNYVWTRDGVTVAGGSATLAVTAQDIGHSFVCTVLAVNGFGAGSSASNAVVVVATQ
jgi:hypothetical protein